MLSIRLIQKSFRKYGFQTIMLLLVVYFLYHLIQGGRGLLSLNSLEEALHIALLRKAEVEEKHEKLSRRVSLMQPEHVDADLLEEVAKENLGVARPEEQVVILDE